MEEISHLRRVRFKKRKINKDNWEISPGGVAWSDLPLDLWFEITQHFSAHHHVFTFREVCRAWYASVRLPLLNIPRPQYMLFPYFPFKISNYESIARSRVFLAQSSFNPKLSPWLFTVEECNKKGKLLLRHPLTQVVCMYSNLPTFFPQELEISKVLDVQVSEISSMPLYTYRCTETDTTLKNNNRGDSCCKALFSVQKCRRLSLTKIDDCSAIWLNDHGIVVQFRLKDGMTSTHFHGTFDDVVNIKGKIYAIDRFGKLYHKEKGWWNMVVDEPVGGVSSDTGSIYARKKRLVESSCGALYIVHRCRANCGVAFKIYELNKERKKWVEINGVGDDRILIATLDGCFFIQAKDLPEWRGNCMVFPRHCFPEYGNSSVADAEIFDGPSESELNVAIHRFESGECRPIESFPGYSCVLWPPPSWLSLGSPRCITGARQTNERLCVV